MNWIEKRIESCIQKIEKLEQVLKSYEGLLGKKDFSEVIKSESNSLKLDEIINLFPELYDKSRKQEVSLIKIVLTMELINIGFGVSDVAKILFCDHSTIINRKKVYFNLLDVKDESLLRAIEIVQNRINGIPSDYPFYDEFVKFIKEKYKNYKELRFVDIALVSILKQKIQFIERIRIIMNKSDCWTRTAITDRMDLGRNELYLQVEKMINLEFENFKNL